MPYRRVRRRISEFFRRDWLEILAMTFGVLLYAVAAACVYAVVYLIATFNEDKFFEGAGPTSQKALSIFGIILFSGMALGSLLGGWGLVGRKVARSITRRRTTPPE